MSKTRSAHNSKIITVSRVQKSSYIDESGIAPPQSLTVWSDPKRPILYGPDDKPLRRAVGFHRTDAITSG